MESSPCNRVRRRVEKRDFRVSQATGKRRLIIPYSYVRLKSHTRRILRSFRPTLKLIGKFNPSIDRRTSKFPPAAFDFLQEPISPSHPVFSHKLSDEISPGEVPTARTVARARTRRAARGSDRPPTAPTGRTIRATAPARDGRETRGEHDGSRCVAVSRNKKTRDPHLKQNVRMPRGSNGACALCVPRTPDRSSADAETSVPFPAQPWRRARRSGT